MPFTFAIASFAASSVSKRTKPYPLDEPSSTCAILQDRIFPKVLKVSYSALLSMPAFVKILDVTHARLSKRRVLLRPHDSAWSSLDRIEIHGVESSFG